MSRLIKYCFYLLFFLVPLIMTPFNYELFEFNKMLLVYLLTAVIVAVWLIKMVIAKKFIFQRTFMDIPLFIFLITQVLSFTFSIDPHTSWWGYYSRFNGGLLSTVAYLLLYWTYVSNMERRDTKGVIRAILISATLVSIYGIAEHFGIDAEYWVQDVQSRVFSTLGQPNWLAAYLVALMPLMWALALQSQSSPKYYILNTIFFTCLLFTHSRSGFLGFAAAYLVFWSITGWLTRQRLKILTRPFLILTSLFLILSFLIGTPWTPKSRQPSPPSQQPSLLISESSDIRKIVWKGAIEIWRHYPIFGTGPETFAYSYYWFRPREHNDVSEWDFLYNKAHNEYLNYAATTGTIGLLAYLFLIIKFIKNYTNTALLSGFVSILVTNFFGFSVVPVSLLFFLFPALSISLNKKPHQNSPKTNFYQKLAVVLILLFAAYSFHFILTYWYADTQFARAEKLNKIGQYDLAFNTLQLAVKNKPQEPIYHDALATTASNLAFTIHEQKKATLAAELKDIAIAESDKALEISPYHLNFWKNRTKLFYQLAKIDPQYRQQALISLLRASQLAPTDAKIKYNLALLYAGEDEIDLAINLLEESVQLKPNYEDAHYALALFYEQRGQAGDARQQLEYILEKINPQSEKAKEKLETL